MSKDITKNKTQLTWLATYEYTEKLFNENPQLKVGVEVGIAGGQHIKHLLETTKLEKIYGVDPFASETWMPEIDVSEFNGLDGIYDSIKKQLSIFDNRVELIRKPSIEAAKNFKNDSLDFVFIDAMHDYENCFADISAWCPKIKKGGYVMGHDWNHPQHPDVQKAVIDFFGNENITGVGEPAHVWYVELD